MTDKSVQVIASYKTRGSKYKIKVIKRLDGSYAVITYTRGKLQSSSNGHDYESAFEYAENMIKCDRIIHNRTFYSECPSVHDGDMYTAY